MARRKYLGREMHIKYKPTRRISEPIDPVTFISLGFINEVDELKMMESMPIFHHIKDVIDRTLKQTTHKI